MALDVANNSIIQRHNKMMPEFDDTVKQELVIIPKRVKSSRKPIKLLSREEIPEYLQHSYGPFIKSYYRPEMSFKNAFRTFFMLHNESFNIWSHFLGIFVMIGLAISFALEPYPTNAQLGTACWAKGQIISSKSAPKWPVYIYLVGTVYVLFISTSVHLFCCMNRHVYYQVWKFDYTAITVVMYTMYYPWVIYIFDCDPVKVTIIYLTIMGVLAVVMVGLGLSDFYQDPKHHAFQPLMFVIFGLCGLAPMIHAAVLYWSQLCAVRYAFYLTFLQLSMNFIGAICFSFRIPERWFPGKLDLVGHSHQIMHLMVLGAFVAYFEAAVTLWKMRNVIGSCH